ncbi:MAG: DUF4271 domain-containing protein [Odoribacteraceae bacterium]|jgi:hypothetical protein|nr:DUF4271 domain-containing protein [Odoribacteraceae bacterium]
MNDWAWHAMNAVDSLVRSARGEYIEALPVAREELYIGMISGTLLCVVAYFALLVMLQLWGRGILTAIFSLFFQGKDSEQLTVKKIASNPFSLFHALFLSFCSLALLVVFLAVGELSPPDLLLYLCFLFMAHFLLLGLVAILGWMFRAREIAREVSIHLWIYNAVPGILLSPAIFSLYYAPPPLDEALLFLIAILFSLYAISRWTRWMKILFKRGVSTFYLILYLCALEILPLLVLYKILTGDFL